MLKRNAENVCKRFVTHRKSIMVILRSEPFLLRTVLSFLMHIPNALALGAKVEAIISSLRIKVRIYDEDEHQWTVRYNRMLDMVHTDNINSSTLH